MARQAINPSELFIVQPKTPEEVDAIADDIHSVASTLPTYKPDYLDAMRGYPEVFTVAYHGDKPIGLIEIRDSNSQCEGEPDIGPNTLVFGGFVDPDYRQYGITQMFAPVVIQGALRRTGKHKMLSFCSPDNREARFALAALGFRYFGDCGGYSRYKLETKP